MTSLGLIAALLIAQSGQSVPPGPGAPPPVEAPPLPEAGPPLTLDDALGQARTRNLDLAVAREQLERSKELHVKAWSAYLPQVTASGSYTHNDFSDVILSPWPSARPLERRDVIITRQDQLDAQVQATQALISPRRCSASPRPGPASG